MSSSFLFRRVHFAALVGLVLAVSLCGGSVDEQPLLRRNYLYPSEREFRLSSKKQRDIIEQALSKPACCGMPCTHISHVGVTGERVRHICHK